MFRWEPFIVEGITGATCSFTFYNNDYCPAVCLFLCRKKRAKAGMRVDRRGSGGRRAAWIKCTCENKVSTWKGKQVMQGSFFQWANNEFKTELGWLQDDRSIFSLLATWLYDWQHWSVCRSIHHFGSDLNLLTVSLKMNCNNFGVPLTFPLLPSSCHKV